MTMHLERTLSSINSSKKRKKLTVGKMKDLQLDWQEHNRGLRSAGRPKMPFDEFLDWTFGRSKIRNPAKLSDLGELKTAPSMAKERASEVHAYPSAKPLSNSDNSMRRKESPQYTGTLIKGIATMHKSNAVPVIDQKHAAEISAMAK